MSHTYTSLFFVTLVALLSPWISIRLFKGIMPAVIIEILLGVIIGSHGLHIALISDHIDFLAEFGFSFPMFLSGLELDFDLLKNRSTDESYPPWLKGIFFFAITLLVSFGLALILYQADLIKNLFVVTLILSTTSVGIVTPALKETGWISHKFGQEVMVYALIADICTLILFTGYITFHSTGNAFSVLLVMVILLIFVILYRFLRLAQRFQFIKIVETATSEIGLRGSFTLILAFLALSKILGTEIVIGAFLAGATISLLSEKHSLLTKKLNSIGYGFLLPIFFVTVGMKFDLASLSGNASFWIVMLLCLAGMYINKLIPAYFLLNKFSIPQKWAGGFLLSSRLSLLIAASQIASQSGILSSTMENGFILLAILTCFLSPVLFSKIISKVQKPEAAEEQAEFIHIDRTTLPDGWIFEQIEIRNRLLHEQPMKHLRLPQDILIISILRGEERIIPRGLTNLEQFDVVQVMGDPSSLSYVKQLFENQVRPLS